MAAVESMRKILNSHVKSQVISKKIPKTCQEKYLMDDTMKDGRYTLQNPFDSTKTYSTICKLNKINKKMYTRLASSVLRPDKKFGGNSVTMQKKWGQSGWSEYAVKGINTGGQEWLPLQLW